MAKYQLKDRVLQEKLEVLDPKFSNHLDRAVITYKTIEARALTVEFGEFLIIEDETITKYKANFTWDEIEEVSNYNPTKWNNYPEVLPPKGIPMRVETSNGTGERAVYNGRYWEAKDRNWSYKICCITSVVRFRPWVDQE